MFSNVSELSQITDFLFKLSTKGTTWDNFCLPLHLRRYFLQSFLRPLLLTFAIGHIVVYWSQLSHHFRLTDFTSRSRRCTPRTRTRQTPRWHSGDRLDSSEYTYALFDIFRKPSCDTENALHIWLISTNQASCFIFAWFQLHPVLSDRGAGRAEKPEARAEGLGRQEGGRGNQDEEVDWRKTRGWVKKILFSAMTYCTVTFSRPRWLIGWSEKVQPL